MAALVEGQQYGLSAQDKINCNKSLVFVKLTDSALRSIEEYVKHKGDNLTKPTLEFQNNNNGVITLPRNGSSQSYSFTLSNVEADGPQGSFECLRQIGQRSLESLGCMLMKMHIHANEDSYEKTRVKMAAAEQEHKKFCTKEIKPNGPHLGRKVKVKRPGLVVSPVKISSPPSFTTTTTTTTTSSSKTAFKPLNVSPVKKVQEQPKFPKTNTKKKYANSPELLRQPIRDRIAHILAVRPYKRPELLVRLMSEGLREKDKKGITAILTQVGTLKGNVYTLANYLWNEVQENWKFCTQEELEIIRKRKQQFLSSYNENEVPNSNNLPSSPVEKRVLPEPISAGEEPRIKKQRISHFNRPDITNSSVKTESSEHSASDKIQPPTIANGHKSPYSPIKLNVKSGPDKSSQRSCSNSPHSSSDSRDSLEYNGSANFQVPPIDGSPPSEYVCPEYMKEYGIIESSGQRAQYKADFNAQYEEYLRLHSRIKCISRRFASLEHNLHTCEEGSEEFKRIKGKIYKEYRAYQQDRNYVDALKQFNFLHCKLSHIKRLVMEYDSAQCVKS